LDTGLSEKSGGGEGGRHWCEGPVLSGQVYYKTCITQNLAQNTHKKKKQTKKKTKYPPCRDTPLVLGSSTPDNPPLSATTASLGLAPSRLNLRYSGRHGATSRLSSQAPSPLFIITTMGIPKARWAQIQTAVISPGCWSPCLVPCP